MRGSRKIKCYNGSFLIRSDDEHRGPRLPKKRELGQEDVQMKEGKSKWAKQYRMER